MRQDLAFSKQEFLTDNATYFLDKKKFYLELKDSIAGELNVPLSMIRICGSAYWGKSFSSNTDFQPGVSDLDLALVDPITFVRAISEVRTLTRNFTNLTEFPKLSATTPAMFQQYAFNKGIVRTDLMPRTKTKLALDALCARVSRTNKDHFSKATISIYDCEESFVVKQINSTKKFRG